MVSVRTASREDVVTITTNVAAATGDLMAFDGTNWVLADADARLRAEFMAMQGGVAADVIQVAKRGTLIDDSAPYTAGNLQYLSATAGAHTATIPAISTTLTILQRVGRARSTTQMDFDLSAQGAALLRANLAYNPASLATVLARSDALTLTGILTTDIIRMPTQVLSGTGWDTGLVLQNLIATAADEVTARLVNPTAGTLDGAAETLELYVERF